MGKLACNVTVVIGTSKGIGAYDKEIKIHP
jgi:hypothetical protein